MRDGGDEEICSRRRLGREPGGADIDKREPTIAGAFGGDERVSRENGGLKGKREGIGLIAMVVVLGRAG